jgi:hypothetical protein
MRPRPFFLSILLILTTIGAGLAIRFAPIDLPQSVVKYGGSALWAMMLYWIVSTVLPTMRLFLVTSLTGVLATSIEVLKLYHSVPLDSFRDTLPGILTLGHTFSPWDIFVYWLAIYVAASVDAGARSRLRQFNW